MQFIFYSVPITCTFTQKHNKSQAEKNRTTSVLLAGYLGASVTTHAPSIAYTAYQPPTGQVLMHTFAEGPQHATSPLSQLSLDFSKQKPLLSKPEARPWQSRGTARDWPQCIFSSSLAVAHPNCRGCQSLTCTAACPLPPPHFDYVERESHRVGSLFIQWHIIR